MPGVTFRYNAAGVPEGLCRAGDPDVISPPPAGLLPEEYGFGYVRALAQGFYGIREVRLIMAVGLDLDGADVEAILRAARHPSRADRAPDAFPPL